MSLISPGVFSLAAYRRKLKSANVETAEVRKKFDISTTDKQKNKNQSSSWGSNRKIECPFAFPFSQSTPKTVPNRPSSAIALSPPHFPDLPVLELQEYRAAKTLAGR